MSPNPHGGAMEMTMSTTTTASGSMATSSSSMSDDSMSDMTMTMADMIMAFFSSGRTPLFSASWTPASDGQYAGTCIFVIVLAVILRVLLALRPILEMHFWGTSSTIVAATRAEAEKQGEEDSRRLLSTQPSRALARVGRDVGRRWAGWRVGTAAARATYELSIAGVGYLLMLIVMTMNVGYFLSVLGGVWLGTFLLGGLSYDDRWAHC